MLDGAGFRSEDVSVGLREKVVVACVSAELTLVSGDAWQAVLIELLKRCNFGAELADQAHDETLLNEWVSRLSRIVLLSLDELINLPVDFDLMGLACESKSELLDHILLVVSHLAHELLKADYLHLIVVKSHLVLAFEKNKLNHVWTSVVRLESVRNIRS